MGQYDQALASIIAPSIFTATQATSETRPWIRTRWECSVRQPRALRRGSEIQGGSC